MSEIKNYYIIIIIIIIGVDTNNTESILNILEHF